jgi:K319L-like, PKD domain
MTVLVLPSVLFSGLIAKINTLDSFLKSSNVMQPVIAQPAISSPDNCDNDQIMCEPENTFGEWCSDTLDNDRDNKVDSNDDDCTSQLNDQLPVADAGPDQKVKMGQEVSLDGTGSYDPDGTIESVEWDQIGSPKIELSGADTLQPIFTAPPVEESTDLTFELDVTDDSGHSSELDTVDITVEPTVGGGPQSTQDKHAVVNAGPDQTGSESAGKSRTNNPEPYAVDQLGNTFSSTLSQVQSTVDQLGNTFSSTLSKINDPVSVLKQNDLSRLLPLAGLGVAAIGGTVAYAKYRSKKKSQHKGGNVAVITRGGIE